MSNPPNKQTLRELAESIGSAATPLPPLPPPRPPTYSQTTKPPKSSAAGKLIVVVAVVVFCLWFLSGPSKPPSAAEAAAAKAEDQRTWAMTMAEQFVKKNLKSPATADFPWPSEFKIHDLGHNEWLVSSYVDSQNGFGALIRSNWVCKLRDNGNGTWNLVDIDIHSR
jgi:hypothetical protein